MKARFAHTLVILLLLNTACGSDGPAGPGGPGGPNNGTFSARIDNTNWSASMIMPAVTAISGGASAIGAGSQTFTVAFAWQDQQGTGTWTIGGGGNSVGFNASLTSGTQQWVASVIGGSGTLTITTRTANRVAGTFSFTMVPVPGTSTTGTRNITNGQFDVTF